MRLASLILPLLPLVVACSRQRDEPADAAASPAASAGGVETVAPSLQAGDVRIINTAGQLDLALIGDSISSGLSPSALEAARRGTDSAAVQGGGLGSGIERMVKGAVGRAIATRVSFPLSEVEDVRYEGGAIRFDWTTTSERLFDQTKVNGRPFLESFGVEDSRRFVDAVRARKRGAVSF